MFTCLTRSSFVKKFKVKVRACENAVKLANQTMRSLDFLRHGPSFYINRNAQVLTIRKDKGIVTTLLNHPVAREQPQIKVSE